MKNHFLFSFISKKKKKTFQPLLAAYTLTSLALARLTVTSCVCKMKTSSAKKKYKIRNHKRQIEKYLALPLIFLPHDYKMNLAVYCCIRQTLIRQKEEEVKK